MKFIHLSDLHLGKRVNGFSLMEDQKYILDQIMDILDREGPDAVVIAGDVYDKPVPPAEAVRLFDDFLCRLAARSLQILVISGNHDSPERIAFGSRLMEASGVHMSPAYRGVTEPVVLSDEDGEVAFYLLPFIKPAHVRPFCEGEEIDSYTDAVRAAVDRMHIDTGCRNVIVTHQLVTGAWRSESEEISIGGSDNVDADVFADFDYVALGHLHGAQTVAGETVRYCGTPLAYSFSEASQKKSLTVVDMKKKGDLEVRTVPLVPLRAMREIKGSYMELTARENYEGTATDDYVHVTLTDEMDVPDAVQKLRIIYPNLMRLDYDNVRTRAVTVIDEGGDVDNKGPLELFAELFEKQNGAPMTQEQSQLASDIAQEIWGDER
ncbi:MAG: exonuclease SbcCD subunit D [Anaerovoracaceae bacterium]|jgi:exonuclease SbcD